MRKKYRSERKGRRSRDMRADYPTTRGITRNAADLKGEVCATLLKVDLLWGPFLISYGRSRSLQISGRR